MSLRQAAMTKRCHTVRTIGDQTVAEHSYHVAMLCIKLTGGKASAELIKAALYHDLPETVTGDVPATAKWKSAPLRLELEKLENVFINEHELGVGLTEEELYVLKVSDSIELAWHCVDQRMLGNKFVREMYFNITNFVLNLSVRSLFIDNVHKEMEKLKGAWNEANN